MKRLKIHWTHLRKAITGTVIFGALSGFPIPLERSLESVLSASPRRQAESILLIALVSLLCYIIRHIVSMLFCHRAGTTHDSVAVPTAAARAAQNGLERWARIHQQPGETISDAVKRLKPFWNERETCEVTITQRRRHEAAHAVITHALGGTVMSANTHFIGDVSGNVEVITPIPSASAAHDMWIRLQISVAGATQDAIDGTLNYGSSNDINTALCGATALTAAGWRPEGYTGPLTPSDLIAQAIEADKQLLAKRQNAIDAVEHALTNKDELNGTEIHKLLDALTATDQGGSDGGQSNYNAPTGGAPHDPWATGGSTSIGDEPPSDPAEQREKRRTMITVADLFCGAGLPDPEEE